MPEQQTIAKPPKPPPAAKQPSRKRLPLVLLVLIVAASWGYVEAIAASIAATLTFNFFFLPPVGTLTVASPTYAYGRVIDHGRNGWLADSHRWEAALRNILRGLDDHRADVAPRAREQARERYGWDRQAATIESALFANW